MKKHNVQEKNEARNMRETIKVIFDFQFGSMVILKTSNVEHINIKLLIRPMNNGKWSTKQSKRGLECDSIINDQIA